MTDAPRPRTLAATADAVGETIKGARFSARAAAIDMHGHAPQAVAIVTAARRDHPGAVHHGWAYRVGPVGPDFHWSDDGEPVGTAGQSILRRIDAIGLLNVIVVVSRWGGAVRLGTADLARGYGEAARAVLAAATPVAFVPCSPVAVCFAYPDSGAVQGVLASFRAEHIGADYAHDVRMVVRVASDQIDALARAIRDATSGSARVEPIGTG